MCLPPFLSQRTLGLPMKATPPTAAAIFLGGVAVTPTPHHGQGKYSAIHVSPGFNDCRPIVNQVLGDGKLSENLTTGPPREVCAVCIRRYGAIFSSSE